MKKKINLIDRQILGFIFIGKLNCSIRFYIFFSLKKRPCVCCFIYETLNIFFFVLIELITHKQS